MTDTDSLMYEIETDDFLKISEKISKKSLIPPTLRNIFRDLTKMSLVCLRTRLVEDHIWIC